MVAPSLLASAPGAAPRPGSSSMPLPAPGPKTIVIKLGTSSILSETTHQPKLAILSSLVETCHALRAQGHKVVIVCSGAIGMGKVRMGLMGDPMQAAGPSSATAPSASGGAASRAPTPLGLGERQALAALGQLRLIALWDSLFGQLGISVAQVLLTRNDIADRPRYLNARTTLQTLLHRFNAVPIVNENDTVSVSELRFGDNDTLSAITAGLIDADYLFLLTDVDGLYTGNPRTDAGARRLGVIDNVAKVRKLVNVSSLGSNFGTGGMMTKLIAAELATAAGVATVIVNGSAPGNIVRVVEKGLPEVGAKGSSSGGDDDVSADARMASSLSSLDLEQEKHAIGLPELTDPPHTIFLPVRHPLKARKWSILHALHPTGTIVIDEGAYRRIARPESGGRLLPAGVVGVEGTWERMQAVRLVARRRAGHGHGAAVTATAAVAAAAAATALSAAPEHESARDESMSAVGTATPPAPPALTKRLTAYLHGESGTGTPGSSSGHVGAGIDSHVSAPGDTIPPPMLPPPPPPPSGPASATTPPAWELVEIGRGLANYNSIDCERIKGLNSSLIASVLGYVESDYVIDELALHALPSEPLR